MKHKSTNKPAVLNLHVDESAGVEEQITGRAHELWQQHGRTPGHELTDWLQAERQSNDCENPPDMKALLKASLNPSIGEFPAAYGHLVLRVAAGLMIFYVHGWHKLEGWIAYLQHGTTWKLAEEVAEMHFPAPLASAVAATMVQFVCSLSLVVGLFTRINGLLLAGVLGVAILQNLLAHRDPQLAILYTLIVITLVFMGGGKLSFDAWLFSRKHSGPSENNAVM